MSRERWALGRMAVKMMLGQGSHFLITMTGVAVSALLIALLLGVYQGARKGSTGYIASSSADLWVSRGNSNNILRSNSFMLASLADEISGIDGAQEVTPVLRILTSARTDRETMTLFLFGIDPASGVSQPPLIGAGTTQLSNGTLIVDQSFARKHRLDVGDELLIQDRRFRIAGFSTATNAILAQFTFCTLSDAQTLFGFPGAASFLLVKLNPGANAHTAIRDISTALPGTAVHTKSEFIDNTLREMETGVLPILWTVAMLSMAVGGTIVTLLLYNSVVGRRHDFALVKAIGGRTSDLYSIVLWQAFVTSACGAAAGIAGAAALAPVLPYVVPELTVSLTPHVLALVALAAVAIAGTGALMPLRKLAGIDPEEVFRS